MTLEEQFNEQADMLEQAMKEKRPYCTIYKMFEVFEDLYEEIKMPSCQQQDKFIKMYFKYVGYTDRN